MALWHGCWQDIGLPAKSVDVVLTDPPYTAHVQANVRSRSTTGPVKVKTFDLHFDPLADFDHVSALLEVARRWVLCFSALESLGDYERAAGGSWNSGGHYVRSGIWRKQQAAPQLSGDRPANSCEGWALMHARPVVPRADGRRLLEWGGRGAHAYHTSAEGDEKVPAYCAPDEEDAGVPDFVESGRERAEKRHPAQKPAALCARLAEWFVRPFPGAVVLDGYAGSGALGQAALDAGAGAIILAETDPVWIEYLLRRFL